MANFIRDYINHRGEDTIIRTIYGILDNKSGEHLVPVQHAEKYFQDYPLTNIDSYPNQPVIFGENGQVIAPIFTFDQMARIVDPVFPYTVTFSGTYTIPDLGELSTSDMTCEVKDAPDSTLSYPSTGKFQISGIVNEQPYTPVLTCTISGRTVNKNEYSSFSTETYSVDFAFTPTAPTIGFKGINGVKPNGLEVVNVDGTMVNVSIDIMTSAYLPETNTTLDDYRLKINTIENVVTEQTPDLDWSFTTAMSGMDVGAINTLTITGRATSDGLFSDYGSVVAKVKPWGAPELATDLPTTPAEYYVGDPINLTVAVNGTTAPEPYDYNWIKDGAPNGASNSPIYDITSAEVEDSGIYSCDVSDSLSRTLSTHKHHITVQPIMAFTTNLPASLNIPIGTAKTLEVGMTGGKGPYTFEWLKTDDTGTTTVGENLTTLSITDAKISDTATYQVKVSCTVGGIVRSITSASCAITVE